MRSLRIVSLVISLWLVFFVSNVNAVVTQAQSATSTPVILEIINKTITVDGKQASVYQIQQPDGTVGYVGKQGQRFNVTVENKTDQPTTLHWHGLIVPNSQDGVPYVTQAPIMPGQSYTYNFPLRQAGTYWMHSHFQLQEQELLAAPLIIKSAADNKKSAQDVVMMLEDFTFKNPAAILESEIF